MPQRTAEDILRKSEETLNRLRRAIDRGVMTREDAQAYCRSIILDGLNAYLQGQRLNCRFTPRSYGSFLEDRAALERGAAGREGGGEPWLFTNTVDYFYEWEAPAETRAWYIRLMDRFGLPPEYCLPLPEGIPHPDKHVGHFDSDLIVGWDIWRETPPEQGLHPGDTLLLTDHYGLKSHIAVTGTEEPAYAGQGRVLYVGEGYLEGYTSQWPRQLRVTVDRGRFQSLYTRVDNDDTAVYQDFPLWQEAFAHRRRQAERLYLAADTLLDRFPAGA